MKILIIGSKKSTESQLLKKKAEERGHMVEIIPLRELICGGQKNLVILTKEKKDIRKFEAVLFRAINQHVIEAKIVAQYMQEAGKIVIDEILAQGNYDYHKFLMHTKMWQKNIPQPATYFPLNLNGLKIILEQIKPPLIVKHIKEMRGRHNFRLDTKKEVLDFFTQNKKQRLSCYLIQEWHPSQCYYRTLVLGNKVLGAMERLSLHCQNRPKIPLNKRSKKADLSPTLKELSLQATQALGIEFAGLDIIPDKGGQWRVLEINRSPRFKRFTQVTGVNVAEEVIKYIERKGLR
jgi:ribosomal protein S6--L-glutamate ligase